MPLTSLNDIDVRLDEAIEQLREQQSLIEGTLSDQPHDVLVRLLSNGLRVYCWLDDQRNGLIEQLGEYLLMHRG